MTLLKALCCILLCSILAPIASSAGDQDALTKQPNGQLFLVSAELRVATNKKPIAAPPVFLLENQEGTCLLGDCEEVTLSPDETEKTRVGDYFQIKVVDAGNSMLRVDLTFKQSTLKKAQGSVVVYAQAARLLETVRPGDSFNIDLDGTTHKVLTVRIAPLEKAHP